MKMKNCRMTAVLATLLATSFLASAEVRFLGHGHTDLALDYDAATDSWDFHVGSDTLGAEFGTDEVVLKVKPAAQTTVPSDPRFAFLGQPGAPVWILPQAQNEELFYLGYGGDGIPEGVFAGNEVTVTLKSVTGPGNFFSYRVDSFGTPVVLFNSADGISSNDVATVQFGGDAHLAWAFSQPGDYSVVLEASGILVAGNTATSSGPVTFTFRVGAGPAVLTTGHTDLAIDYSPDADAWDVHVGSDSLEQAYDADDVILQVKGEAKTAVPSDPKFAFLGSAGASIWILPQAQDENLLFLGYGGDGIPNDVFAGNQVKVALKSVTGPGNFFSYRVDQFGTPVVLFNSADGISSNDVATVQSGGDAHLNWAFTKAGDYSVTVEVSGTLAADNQVVSSGQVTFSFIVEGVLTDQHTDIQTLYDANAGSNALSLVARDVTDGNVDYPTNKVLLVVSKIENVNFFFLPAGTPFGNEGDPLWTITQSQFPDVLYLGVSAEGIPSGVFQGPLTVQLKAVDGPGNFFLYQVDSFGVYDIQMNSADGITAADAHQQIIGSHEHFNWGFTANGVYYLTLQVSGQRVGDTSRIYSPEATFRFDVLPLPTNAPPSDIQLSNPQALADGTVAFDLRGAENKVVDVQETADFVQWSPVTVNLAITNSPQPISIPADTTRPRRFFRVLLK